MAFTSAPDRRRPRLGQGVQLGHSVPQAERYGREEVCEIREISADQRVMLHRCRSVA
ncbi:hypothetical protein ACIQMR_34860 [Streptomyces sp. NPDC091376]|uniref:hypothetical protein n=1 Tax=Streptomyces sp. NPDC091376 TaxID=3365994 RepID=UPI003819DA70